jgi:hypothetical protein
VVYARWTRADGSKGEVWAHFRPKTAERLYIARLLVDLPSGALLRDVPFARIESAANADAEIRAWIESGSDPETIELIRREAAKRPRLRRPARRQLDDDFYARVATAYRAAVAAGLHPAQTLAADSATPVSSVRRWIAEARARDYLPDAEQGRVTV